VHTYQGFRVFNSFQYLSPVFNETRPERVLKSSQAKDAPH
jgi:hypothetical protein